MTKAEVLYQYVLTLGDTSMVLGHRLSELCGHGPTLETDIACTNIALDLFGQVRSYFQYAAKVKGAGTTEDSIAYFRNEREFRNLILVEQPNTDFAHVIVRQFLYDAFHLPLLQDIEQRSDVQLSAIATKSIKESKYHRIFSSEWMKRLGDGTDLSRQKVEEALKHLFPFYHESKMFTNIETRAYEMGFGADIKKVGNAADDWIAEILNEAGLVIPDVKDRFAKGKEGIHTEHLGYILAEFQSTQRAYPNMEW